MAKTDASAPWRQDPRAIRCAFAFINTGNWRPRRRPFSTKTFSKGVIAMSIEKRLAELGIVLPPLGATIGTFVHARQFGQLMFMSGKGPLYPDGVRAKGKLGA